MRTFTMMRDEDVTGVSGTGPVAQGVEFDDGTVVIRWTADPCSTVIWPDLPSAEMVHGHDGRTRFVFD